jgi:hypothetical protein
MSQLTRQKLSLIFVSLTLIISLAGFLLANRSLGWFSKNDKASAEGMSVNVEVSPNLIIAKTTSELSQNNLLFSVSFEEDKREGMIAVTHDKDAGNTNLKYLQNHYAVSHTTGLVNPGATLDFRPVPETDNDPYFVDFVVYIASALKPLDASSLTASIIIPNEIDQEHTYFMAASIDFYVDEVSDENYKGTTSVADVVNDAEGTSIELLAEGGETIPLNTDGYITVIMRCYFDGALTTPDGSKAYVNSFEVKTDGIAFGVEFVATDKAE